MSPFYAHKRKYNPCSIIKNKSLSYIYVRECFCHKLWPVWSVEKVSIGAIPCYIYPKCSLYFFDNSHREKPQNSIEKSNYHRQRRWLDILVLKGTPGLDQFTWTWSISFPSSLATTHISISAAHSYLLCLFSMLWAPVLRHCFFSSPRFAKSILWANCKVSSELIYLCDDFFSCLLILHPAIILMVGKGTFQSITTTVEPFYCTTTKGSGLSRLINVGNNGIFSCIIFWAILNKIIKTTKKPSFTHQFFIITPTPSLLEPV